MPDFRNVYTSAGNISTFAENRMEPTYKYGTYISGSAVRQDAAEIFKRLSENVCIHFAESTQVFRLLQTIIG
jgi:hypothetical protein